jgi:hypothetical protein
VLIDTAAARRTVIDARLPLEPVADLFALARDDCAIIYGGERSDSDIWIVERK